MAKENQGTPCYQHDLMKLDAESNPFSRTTSLSFPSMRPQVSDDPCCINNLIIFMGTMPYKFYNIFYEKKRKKEKPFKLNIFIIKVLLNDPFNKK